MSIQFLSTHVGLSFIQKYQILRDSSQIEAIIAPSYDYSFDFIEDELAQGLFAPQAESTLDQSDQVVDADEFDSLYRWFAS